MTNNINLNDLCKVGINENRLTHCFAQKGLRINNEDLDWMRRSFLKESTIDVKSTVRELSVSPFESRDSYASVDESLAESSTGFGTDQHSVLFELFERGLSELRDDNLLGAQTHIFEFSEIVFSHKNLAEIKKLKSVIQSWMKKLKRTATSFYFYVELRLAIATFSADYSKEAFYDFHAAKAELIRDKCAIQSNLVNSDCLITSERVFQTLEILEQEFYSLIQTNSEHHERLYFRDFSNVACVRELYFNEVAKIEEVYFGNSHVLWTCEIIGRKRLFGFGDNTFGQILGNSELKFLNRPLLLWPEKEIQFTKVGAQLDISFACDDREFFIWGKSVEGGLLRFPNESNQSVTNLLVLNDQLIFSNNENEFYAVLWKRSFELNRIGKINQMVRQISAGNSHFFVLTFQGELFAFGKNSHNQINEETSHADFTQLENVENVAGERILAVACLGDLTVLVDCTGVCYIFGRINARKSVRYPESFQLFEGREKSTGHDWTGNWQSVKISGNENKVVVLTDNTYFEWATELAMKFKPVVLDENATFKNVHLSKTFEFSEKRNVFGANCHFSVEREKIKNGESVNCRVGFRDADECHFKSTKSKEVLTLQFSKCNQRVSESVGSRVAFSCVLFQNSGLEIRSKGPVELNLKNLNFRDESEISFDIGCGQVGLFVFQMFCNGKKMKNEFLMEVLRGEKVKQSQSSEDRSAFNNFLTSSSFRPSVVSEQETSYVQKTEETENKMTDRVNNKVKLKPIEGQTRSIFVHKSKNAVARYGSIKRKEGEQKSVLEERFPGKFGTRLPALPEMVLNGLKLKSEKFAFKKL